MRFGAASADSVRRWLACAADRDWQSFCDLTQSSRLAALVHYILQDEALPAPWLATLRAARLANQLRTIIILGELGGLLRVFEAHGLSAIVLKGAALAETVYPRPDLRPLGDVDLLVHRSDLKRLQRALLENGYRPLAIATHRGMQEAFENEMVFRKPGRVVIDIDVHWSLFDSPYYQSMISMDWFWESSREALVGGASTRVLGIEAEIIHLCGHLCLHHQGTERFWLHDIAEVVDANKDRINWAKLVERTRTFELILPVRDTLRRVASLWGVAIPTSVLTELEASEPSFQEKRVHAWLTEARRPASKRLWADVRSLPNWSLRLRFLSTNLIPSREYMRRRYAIRNSALLPFYYPYRWYRGIRGLE
ncbi:MAG: nucleotidyltransferase family protein [Deltaproteobacteria bacterium]|nr:nucleotidyltransferase family protein [Deltaproteobacteria bacterium]